MKIKVRNTSGFSLPRYQSEQAAGMDLQCASTEPIVLRPLERKLFPTGLYIELPAGYEAQVRPRSGMALRMGFTVLNTPGTIDADYRGEIGVIGINLSQDTITIQPGDRIAQLVVSKYESAEWVEVEELASSKRGNGGFGHSGK